MKLDLGFIGSAFIQLLSALPITLLITFVSVFFGFPNWIGRGDHPNIPRTCYPLHRKRLCDVHPRNTDADAFAAHLFRIAGDY